MSHVNTSFHAVWGGPVTLHRGHPAYGLTGVCWSENSLQRECLRVQENRKKKRLELFALLQK